MITSSHLDKLSELGGVACEACHDDAFASEILCRVNTLLGANGCGVHFLSGPLAHPIVGENHLIEADPYYIKLFWEYYKDLGVCYKSLKVDPQNPFLLTSSTMRVVKDVSKYVGSEFYQDYLKPQGSHSTLLFTLRNCDGLLGAFHVHRPVSRPVFDEDSHLLVRLAAPALIYALTQRRAGKKADTVPSGMFGDVLTLRQLEIAKFVAAGLTNVEIAYQLGISVKTIENHLTQIYEKTRARNRITLAQSLGD